MSVRIDAGGNNAELEDLWEWLRAERALRGLVRLESGPSAPGTMGSGLEITVQIATVISGAGALWAAVAQSVALWLDQRRTDITITVTKPDGTTVQLSAKRPAEAKRLMAEFAEQREVGDGDPTT
ncbi:effector-associated constant component EACC1 [Micromonospora sp. NBC_01796]|uniref:effector-associated constant component EACC1 n=1 Tax=Micromonospora sp. NBC_01796 TaxID=2975987 RepID=UPI002DD9769D|nr:hypothetical protein [Micromonospora sp. NBC_01796]WSA88938.1 hypothetical protein OIE47_15735 [Micromonospora sp. NBC_01796]